jgi:general stress protein 26
MMTEDKQVHHDEVTLADRERELWDQISKIGTCMLTYDRAGDLVAQPMRAIVLPEPREIAILTHVSAFDMPLGQPVAVNLAFISDVPPCYISLSGKAQLTQERDLIAQLWNDKANLWMPEGPDDDDIGIITVRPERASYWISRDGVARLGWEVAKARLLRTRPGIGEHVDLKLDS